MTQEDKDEFPIVTVCVKGKNGVEDVVYHMSLDAIDQKTLERRVQALVFSTIQSACEKGMLPYDHPATKFDRMMVNKALDTLTRHMPDPSYQ